MHASKYVSKIPKIPACREYIYVWTSEYGQSLSMNTLITCSRNFLNRILPQRETANLLPKQTHHVNPGCQQPSFSSLGWNVLPISELTSSFYLCTQAPDNFLRTSLSANED